MTFAFLFAALYVRMIRANVMEALGEDYVRTARAKGAPEWRVMRSHVLRNALLPVVTMLGMDIGMALGGAIFTESVFGLPGLGKTAIQRDRATSTCRRRMGMVVFATLCIIAFNLIVDLLYAVDRPDESDSPSMWPSSKSSDLKTYFRTDDGIVRAVDGVSASPSTRARRSGSWASPARARASPA